MVHLLISNTGYNSCIQLSKAMQGGNRISVIVLMFIFWCLHRYNLKSYTFIVFLTVLSIWRVLHKYHTISIVFFLLWSQYSVIESTNSSMFLSDGSQDILEIFLPQTVVQSINCISVKIWILVSFVTFERKY